MTSPAAQPRIIVHGGAGTIPPDQRNAYAHGTQQAAEAGQAVLDRGGSAQEAVIAAVVAMENDPAFNAATGSALTAAGLPQCDAFVMLDDHRCGGVAGVYGILNPVLLAQAVMQLTPHCLLCGTGAEDFADEQGIARCDPQAQIIPRRYETWQRLKAQGDSFHGDPEMEDRQALAALEAEDLRGTVGACALDSSGRLAVASSTGGIMLKLPGRVGDTPLPGAGSYCGPAGAVTCTGHGEAAMRVCLAKHCYDLLAAGMPVLDAARQAIEHMEQRTGGKAGLIALDAQGERAYCTCTRAIAVGVPGELLLPLSGSGLL